MVYASISIHSDLYRSGRIKAYLNIQVLSNRRSLRSLRSFHTQLVLTLCSLLVTIGQRFLSHTEDWPPLSSLAFPLGVYAFAPVSVFTSACLAMVFNALPSLNHAIWLSLKVCCSDASHTLPSLGWTLNVKGSPTANCVHMTSTLSSGLILS